MKRVQLEEDFMDVATIVHSLTRRVYSSVKLEYGKWPMCQRLSENHSVIFLPLVKGRGEEFHRKLQMLAAHECGHVLYTVPTFQVQNKDGRLSTLFDIRKSMTKMEANVLNWLEDIRIEKLLEKHTHANLILPMPFPEFRRLFSQQVKSSGPEAMLLTKVQWQLMGDEYELPHPLNDIYEKHFKNEVKPLAKILSQYFHEEESLQETLSLTYRLVEILTQLFPPEEQDKDGMGEGAGSNGSGDGEITEVVLSKNPSSGSGGGIGQDIEIPESVLQKIRELQQELLDSGKITKEEFGDISGPSFNVEGDDQQQISQELLNELNEVLGSYENISYLQRVAEMTPSEAQSFKNETVTKYGTAITSFRRLFSGGWRAPRKGVRSGVESGELDTNLLYKARLRGKDRGMYMRTTTQTLPGVNILVCIDNSGSMSNHITRIMESGCVLNEASTGQKNTRMRLVFFTDTTLVSKDWKEKRYKYFSYSTVNEYQGSTPTGGILKTELPGFRNQPGDKFLVVVTDGAPDRPDEANAEIARYRKAGIYTLLIKFGSRGGSMEGFDEELIYSGGRLSNLPKILAQDVNDLIKRYAKKKMRAVG